VVGAASQKTIQASGSAMVGVDWRAKREVDAFIPLTKASRWDTRLFQRFASRNIGVFPCRVRSAFLARYLIEGRSLNLGWRNLVTIRRAFESQGLQVLFLERLK
jgi:hypothetical protein